MTLAVFFVAAALWQEPPSAPPAARERTVDDIAWVRRPFPEFPERAIQARIQEGEVRVRCNLTTAGRFADCQVTEETPRHVGFGPAALSAVRRARFDPAATSPQPGDSYEGLIRFRSPHAPRRR